MNIEQFYGADKLRDDEKNEVSQNGSGAEYAGYIRMSRNGKTIHLYSDAMEPEDATFGRDLSWIAKAIHEAYDYGWEDGNRGTKKD